MREIKFRAWDGIRMRYPREISFNLPQQERWSVLFFGEDPTRKYLDSEVNLMQYIGLKDKNNREIYVGDILKWTHPTFQELKKEYKVLEVRDIRRSLMIEPDCSRGWIEVIGNVYENKNLLPDSK